VHLVNGDITAIQAAGGHAECGEGSRLVDEAAGKRIVCADF
jgi:hypothetical protein